MMTSGETRYPLLFSPWRIRSTQMPNRIVFAPTCPTWVADPVDGTFTDQAVAYYEERAKAGCGLIIIGGTVISDDTLYSGLNFPGLWSDEQVSGLAAVNEAVQRHGCRLAIQLLHIGLRGEAVIQKDPAYDLDAAWYTVAPSQVPPGEYPHAPMPKELEDDEIEDILDAFAAAGARAVSAGLDGVEFHMSHGYLPWQFLSPLYNHRADRWGGSYENRLRFPLEALTRMRDAMGDGPFIGYRINSTSFWPGDLEMEDVKQIVADIEQSADIDYVSLSAGVHHSFIHTPMTYEQGWERGYTREVKEVSTKPVLLVGRITYPVVAEEILASDEADAILLARQLFADAQWPKKVREGREDDIRRCVAANYCWRNVIAGGRVQCVYNPEVGRERQWGEGTLVPAEDRKRVVVIGAGPAGLEYARVAAARSHDVLVLERETDTGGHVVPLSLLPGRAEYGQIAQWLHRQAEGNGAELRTGVEVGADDLRELISAESADHVVVATGARYRNDGWQGQTAQPIPGWETGNCVAWDEVARDRAAPSGEVIVLDDLQGVAAPLTAVKLADAGCRVRLVTRWPMIGMDTIPEVYYIWVRKALYQAGVEIVPDLLATEIRGEEIDLLNVYTEQPITTRADWIVMATGRESVNDLYRALKAGDASVEAIGDAVAPRTAYDAVYEGHRQARRL